MTTTASAPRTARASRWLLLPFMLLFIGDAQLPIGESKLTVPSAMFVLLPMLVVVGASGRLAIPRPALMLIGVVLFGAIGTALTAQALPARAAAGGLPLVFATIALCVYARQRVSREGAVTAMLVGGALLAVAIIALYIYGIGTEKDHYELKLLIETPLGRSNYLAAFLVFLVALSASRSLPLTALFALAILCTMSRGGLLALLLLFVAIPLARRGRLWMVGVASIALFAIVLWLAATGRVEILELFIDESDARFDSTVNRLLLWTHGVDLWVSQPLFGIGPNTFRSFVELGDGIEDVWGVHNSILLMLLNYGVAGAVLYAGYLGLIYTRLRQAECHDAGFTPLRAAFIVLLVFGLFEPLIGSAAFEMLLALLLVLAQAAPASRQVMHKRPARLRLANQPR